MYIQWCECMRWSLNIGQPSPCVQLCTSSYSRSAIPPRLHSSGMDGRQQGAGITCTLAELQKKGGKLTSDLKSCLVQPVTSIILPVFPSPPVHTHILCCHGNNRFYFVLIKYITVANWCICQLHVYICLCSEVYL